ncbi:hypothetical protein LXL04_035568 [Taraxacum kok-saghyz]
MVHGTHAFQYPTLDDRFNKVFNNAMVNHTTIVINKVLECYRGFDNIKHVIDVGAIEHIGGHMFEEVPKSDVIFMKWILHDWSDDLCEKLLKNCYKALPNEGKLIVVESILPLLSNTSSSDKATAQLDASMMAQNPGGKERTEEEFLYLARSAGFTGIKMKCFVCNLWVMEFYK